VGVLVGDLREIAKAETFAKSLKKNGAPPSMKLGTGKSMG
jgi:hypothetical protein